MALELDDMHFLCRLMLAACKRKRQEPPEVFLQLERELLARGAQNTDYVFDDVSQDEFLTRIWWASNRKERKVLAEMGVLPKPN
jgi:hypothetical protein